MSENAIDQVQDDVQGHRMSASGEPGEAPVEGGRRAARLTDDGQDDVQGHRVRAIGEPDDDQDDVQGHRRF